MMSPEGTKRVVESLLNDYSEDAVEALITFSRHLATHPVSEQTEHLYKKILERNIIEAADLLIGQIPPVNFWDSLSPNQENVEWAIKLLKSNKVSELYIPIALSALGLIDRGYEHLNEAVAIYKTSKSDIFTIAKYLIKKDKRTEVIILRLMEGFASLFSPREVALTARSVLNAWAKSPEELISILPHDSSSH